MNSTISFNQINFKVGELESNSRFLQPSEACRVFTESFDLSLLPDDSSPTTTAAETTNNSVFSNEQNIPTTVYQYNESSVNSNISSKNNSSSLNLSSPPEIKIEHNWSNTNVSDNKEDQQYSFLYEHLSRNQDQKSNHSAKTYLIPPPPYPNIYPSPQSSPSQSEYNFSFSHNTGYYESLNSSRSPLFASSPSPVFDVGSIKQELHILPPSPPDSNCEAHSPKSSCTDIKSEPFDTDVETSLIDLKALLEQNNSSEFHQTQREDKPFEAEKEAENLKNSYQQENLLLRDCLEEKDFQKKFNIKPLALESFIEGLGAESEDFEPVISLAFEHVKQEAEAICAKLHISQDPTAWSPVQVHAWLRSTIEQFKLPQIENLESKFNEDGASLVLLTEEEFVKRVPEGGGTLHAQLEIWKMVYCDEYQRNNLSFSEFTSTNTTSEAALLQSNQQAATWGPELLPNLQMDIDDESEDEEEHEASSSANGQTTSESSNSVNNTNQKKPGLSGRTGGSHIHLWQFLKELLQSPHLNGTAIRWIDRSKGIFKIEDSVRVAKLWGKRKNRPAMNYDKLSRSIRQYYKKGIMKKTERSQRLVYQFCHPYYL